MLPENLKRLLDNFDPGRRGFLRKIIAGAAFAPPLIASFSLEGPALPSAEATPTPSCSNQTTRIEFFDFSDNEYQDNFRGILRAGDINPGTDLAGGGHTSLNFTGSTGSAGSTWLTVFDGNTPLPEDACALALEADILFHTFNNSKGAGLLALFNEGIGKKGLALLVFNAGNTDSLQLVTVDQAGKLGVLRSVSLGNNILENAWYRLRMVISDTSQPTVAVTGTVFRHAQPNNPNSPQQPPAIATLGPVAGALPTGVQATGEVGLVARAVSAVVDVSITNYTITESPQGD